MRTEEQIQEHISQWIATASGLPVLWEEPTQADETSPPQPTPTTVGVETMATCLLLDGPRRVGMAATRLPNSSREARSYSDREITIDIKVEGPDAFAKMGEILQGLEGQEPAYEVLSSQGYAFRALSGPLHLQRDIGSTYVRVEQATLTLSYQETWARTVDVIESMEGTATASGISMPIGAPSE